MYSDYIAFAPIDSTRASGFLFLNDFAVRLIPTYLGVFGTATVDNTNSLDGYALIRSTTHPIQQHTSK